jgi:hypothetical protein
MQNHTNLLEEMKSQDQVYNRRLVPISEKRPSTQHKIINILSQVEDNEDDKEKESFEIVYFDDEGAFGSHKKRKKPYPYSRNKKTTEVLKIDNILIVDPNAKETIPVENGYIKINISKFILIPVTNDNIIKLQKLTPTKINLNHYYCTLHTYIANNKHPQFISIGPNTGNLMKHVEQYHAELITGIKSALKTTKKEVAIDQIQEYIAKQKIPSSQLTKYFSRNQKFDLQMECKYLIWFLDANIPFNQFDNPLFQDVCLASNVKLGGSKTIIDSHLDLLYNFVQNEQIKEFRMCSSFMVSFDAFTRHNTKFFSQHYHMINTKTFKYIILHFDLIPYFGQLYADMIASALKTRQEHWTQGMNQLIAGAIADAEYKGQAAASRMVGVDDKTICQNHKTKRTYEAAEQNSNWYKNDFNAIKICISFIAQNANIRRDLASFQRIHELVVLAIYLFNETRWEGRYKALKRFILLREALEKLFAKSQELKEWKINCPDFLTPAFFERCQNYVFYLSEMNSMSKFYQNTTMPTGSFVPYMILYLQKLTIPDKSMDAAYLLDFKIALHDAIGIYLFEPVCKTKNNFLKAALLNPSVARVIVGLVDGNLIEECFHSILEDAISLEHDMQEFVQLSLKFYRENIISTPLELPNAINWSLLNKDGKIDNLFHMDFWQAIATRNLHNGKCSHLINVAAMLLAQLAGESIDESAFSGVGATMRKDRLNLSTARIEQITIIRSFIRNFKWSPEKLQKWISEQI